MVAPRKSPELLMNVDLRTPVTREQKALIRQASQLSGLGIASWCRQVLLKAAKGEIDRDIARKPRPST
jgi:hypothetical protein